ncbi:trimethylamine methyltransferase family protein [Kiloniella sp.]|uniref:trimethylamine methyltransferase family protein n=1 Tax=Kiloniella sp. TaxID=1938587 RepID=UPI003B015E93
MVAVETTRRGGRGARRTLRENTPTGMLPHLTRGLPYTEPLLQDQIARIHDASMKILEEVGVDFRDEISLRDWKRVGARVEGERVYFDRAMIMDLISSIPSTIKLHARDPQKSVTLGEGKSIFVPMTGAPFIRDLEGKRRWGQLADLNNFHKLAHVAPALHSTAHVICEPMDVAVSHRHLWITYSSMIHSDKTFMGMSTTGENAADVIEMCKILFGADFIDTHAVATANINGNSPLVWDESMLGALRAFSSHNQPVLCSPFVLGGANTPASTVPAVAQLNAEALAALAYTQVVRKGAPAIYGHYLSTVSMASGAPMAGTPEISLMNFMIGQMARFYEVPWRTSNTLGGAKNFDAQSGYESATTMMAVMMAGANYIWHSAGWNEAGMHCCMAKFVVDSEQCAMAYRMTEGPRWDDFDEAIAAVKDIGPGGHYLGHAHTLKNFERAFFMPKLFDNNNIEQWEADGAKDLPERAHEHAAKLLSEYEMPPIDTAVDEALKDFIARREREIPDQFK